MQQIAEVWVGRWNNIISKQCNGQWGTSTTSDAIAGVFGLCKTRLMPLFVTKGGSPAGGCLFLRLLALEVPFYNNTSIKK